MTKNNYNEYFLIRLIANSQFNNFFMAVNHICWILVRPKKRIVYILSLIHI